MLSLPTFYLLLYFMLNILGTNSSISSTNVMIKEWFLGLSQSMTNAVSPSSSTNWFLLQHLLTALGNRSSSCKENIAQFALKKIPTISLSIFLVRGLMIAVITCRLFLQLAPQKWSLEPEARYCCQGTAVLLNHYQNGNERQHFLQTSAFQRPNGTSIIFCKTFQKYHLRLTYSTDTSC